MLFREPSCPGAVQKNLQKVTLSVYLCPFRSGAASHQWGPCHCVIHQQVPHLILHVQWDLRQQQPAEVRRPSLCVGHVSCCNRYDRDLASSSSSRYKPCTYQDGKLAGFNPANGWPSGGPPASGLYTLPLSAAEQTRTQSWMCTTLAVW